MSVALSADELRTIAEHLGRQPTETELYAFDAQWSEHCSYKSSRHFLRRLPTDGPTVMQGPAEDAGILHLGTWKGDRYGVVIAHESHNHPSQVVPYEGAATGVGGIVRDVLCMGAEVIGLADPLRFGRLEDPHCRYVAQSVVDGIAAYGNAIGVPNLGGDVYVDESFDDNVLVNVVALGLVKEQDIIHSHAPKNAIGYDIVLVGKATDRSGFGGASFSSLTLDDADAEANKGAVQVPDPFLKNVIMRASYQVFAELRKLGIEAGYKDLGAGGFVGCSAELCAAGGVGAEVELDRVPTSQADLPPAVIAIGETQERLCWIVPPSFTPLLLAIYNEQFSLPRISRSAAAAIVGKVVEGSRYVARHHGEIVMDVDLNFLTGGVRYNRPYSIALPNAARPAAPLPRFPNAGVALDALLAHRDVASRQAIFQRYDGVVRGTTAIPRGAADAGVICPIPGAPLGVALAVAGNPRYGKLDPQAAAEHAVVEAVRNVVAVGARPLGLTDCLNFGDPTVPEHLGAMVAAVDGLAYAARRLETPYVSGNVSLYNQSKSGRTVAPSPIVACVGGIDDIARTASMAFKRPNSVLYFVGQPEERVGGSVYADLLGITDALPAIDYDRVAREIELVLTAFERDLILAAHDVSDGGALVALAKMAFATRDDARIGIRLEPSPLDGRAGTAAFGEACGFLIEAADGAAFLTLALSLGIDVLRLGETTAAYDFTFGDVERPLDALYETWSAPLRDFYAPAPVAGAA
ncbi:MAG TPA: phosphoribosylformylglycinamidine synthase subunit PurL [Candidatus Lustribacter sp.]|nr:phosphoribosylformylglycinamidine synthase subunit PurL [Candidatus Lustribacter sp.]